MSFRRPCDKSATSRNSNLCSIEDFLKGRKDELMAETLTPHEKAFRINMDAEKYGTFAEIGAGQEVARWFFRVGGAAGTMAKSMSAYDMTFSDAIYGKSTRYVARDRLIEMVSHEYDLLIERLSEKRGDDTTFFAFANTCTARAYKRKNECHGWMGVRFQTTPNGEPNDIIIHVRMLDNENLAQQEALGIVGVNLIYGTFYHYKEPEKLVDGLLDDLTTDRIEIDMIKLSGPDFEGVDNRVMSLRLVQKGLSMATMFSPDGSVLQPSEILYKKAILLERGRFRPVTKVNLEMMEAAGAQFTRHIGGHDIPRLEIMEISMNNLLHEGELDMEDFLARVDLLGALGKTVLISSYAEFHRLGAYLSRYTKEPIGIVLGFPLLKEIFNEKYYSDLAGGILESFGRLFKNKLQLYVYPAKDPNDDQVHTAHNLIVADNLKHLYKHLINNQFIVPIKTDATPDFQFSSRKVLKLIESGDPKWKRLVTPQIAKVIKDRGYFGVGKNKPVEAETSS